MPFIENKIEIDLAKAYHSVREIQKDVIIDTLAFLRAHNVENYIIQEYKRKYGLNDGF